ncbi:hypothetical protein DSO57_1030380 [Entomophthora muscae]|uniref:Uncharacterized protein n=1 Tax=Entomophthora muscae TaxID=34485 RepID=A0ACC2UAD8_9FUNG|nr:hypothetical protein DSO57_1030380 [Entomophthora muscae]
MVQLTKFLAFLSRIANFFGGLFGRGNGSSGKDNLHSEVSGKTEGSFAFNKSMYLAEGVGWVDWASRFTAFHLQPEWYGKETVVKMKYMMVPPGDTRLWTFDPEFYRFDGGKPISEELDCPYQTTCLVMADWQKFAWHVECVMFAKQKKYYPCVSLN